MFSDKMYHMADDISIIVYAHNEEKNITDCIKSARLLTKNIIVIDTQSTDETVNIAKKMGVVIYSAPHHVYVEPTRKFGIQKASADWIFLLDADERIDNDLANEIKSKINSDVYTHYKIPRKNIFAQKKWLQYGGWYPDYVIRLFRKSAFVNWSHDIHSTPAIKGQCGFLKKQLTHYFHPSLTNMVEKTIVFEEIESDLLYRAGKKVNTAIFMRKFLGELNRRLIIKVGFLDGNLGIIESLYQAFSKTLTYIFLYEKYKKNSSI